jgi:TrpR-related protein YerC/YecD
MSKALKGPKHIDLYEAILMLKDKKELQNFFRDLCTPGEINALNERWKVCQLIDKGGLSYREIHSLVGASVTTIGRVARFLKDEPYKGYRTVLDRLNKSLP